MRINTLYAQAGRLLRDFCSARGGNVTITVAFASVALIGFVGAAVDYSRANSLKAAMQGALDATTLKLGREYYNLSGQPLQNQGDAIFAAIFTRPEAISPTIKVVSNQSTIQATGSASLDTAFLGVLGIKKLNIDATSTTAFAVQSSLRVALVLDNTGSMSQAGKMPALQTAAKNMLAKLQGGSTTSGDVYVSIIPFVKDVNLGASNYNQPWVMWDDGTDSSWDGSKGTCSLAGYATRSKCVANGSCSISGNTTPQTCAVAGTCSISSYTSQSTCTAAGACSNPAETTKSTCTGTNACSNSKYTTKSKCTANGGIWGKGTWSAGVWSSAVWSGATWTPTSHNSWNGCVVDRGDWTGPSTSSYDTNVTAPTTSIPATMYVPEQYSSCPQAAMGLSYNWSGMTTLINNMSPAGNTNQAIGLQLGWMSLMTGGVFNAPAKASGTTYAEHIVLLTDGLNTEDRWYTDQGSIDAREQILCDNIKATGVTLWTIQVNTGGDPKSTLLENCASDKSKFYLLTSASQIISTFDDISFKIVRLHLAR
jgi:Flp pilus assembly protein TadG